MSNKKVIIAVCIGIIVGIIFGIFVEFETIKGFLLFYIPISIILLLGIIFEEKLIALEDRFDAWYTNWKQNRK